MILNLRKSTNRRVAEVGVSSSPRNGVKNAAKKGVILSGAERSRIVAQHRWPKSNGAVGNRSEAQMEPGRRWVVQRRAAQRSRVIQGASPYPERPNEVCLEVNLSSSGGARSFGRLRLLQDDPLFHAVSTLPLGNIASSDCLPACPGRHRKPRRSGTMNAARGTSARAGFVELVAYV